MAETTTEGYSVRAPVSTLVASGSEGGRDARLDVFRGLALVTIFINHVPGNVFEILTSRNFGFSDAAEAFVLMSGIAAGLAYCRIMTEQPQAGTRRIWARAWTLYVVHIVTTTMAIGIAAAAALWFGAARMIEINNMAPLLYDPLGAMVGLPTLGHQLGYFNILPLYMVLLLATPGMIILGRDRPWHLLALAVAVWAVAGLFRLNLPAYPNPGGWFFNPFSWQLVFVVGLLSGMAARRGERLVPHDPRLFWTCVAFLAAVLVWRLVPPVAEAGREAVRAGYDAGLPFFVAGFDKTFLSLPRLLHVLALFYVVVSIPRITAWASSVWLAPIALMGRHALPVFATGSVLSIVGQAIRTRFEDGGLLLDAWVILGGLGLQLLMALAFAMTVPPKPAPRGRAA